MGSKQLTDRPMCSQMHHTEPLDVSRSTSEVIHELEASTERLVRMLALTAAVEGVLGPGHPAFRSRWQRSPLPLAAFSAFVEQGDSPTVIDEVQRGGNDLILAIKTVVDDRNDRGQFVLASSTRFLSVPQLAESLAGRAGDPRSLAALTRRAARSARAVPRRVDQQPGPARAEAVRAPRPHGAVRPLDPGRLSGNDRCTAARASPARYSAATRPRSEHRRVR